MGCGSAKISLTHRRGGGKRRDGDNSEDSDTEAEEGAAGGGGSGGGGGRHQYQHQLRGSHKVRPASLVTSTSVDSQLLKSTTNKRPKITTSFSQNDFSTTTSVSGTSRIRVTLSHDGSLLEVETETFEILEEAEADDDTDAAAAAASAAAYDPDAIRAFDEDDTDDDDRYNRKSYTNPPTMTSSRTLRYGHHQEAAVFPSCSGTQQGSASRVSDVRRLCGGGGGGGAGGGGDSSSGSSSRAGGGVGDSVTSVRRLVPSRGCDSEDEEDYDDSTEVTAFIAVADIEVEPSQVVKTRATRSKSINSILSQAEENHLHDLELKPRKTCKECGCKRNSNTKNDGANSCSSRMVEQDSNPSKDKIVVTQETLIKNAAKSIERTSSATESSDGDIQKDSSRKSSRSGGSTPYKTASQQKRKSDKRKPLPDGASPLAVEKHTECCCYCHQKRRSKGRSKSALDGDTTDSSLSMVSGCHGSRAQTTGHHRADHPNTSKNSSSKSRENAGKRQTTFSNETPVEQVRLLPTPEPATNPKKMAWSKQNSAERLGGQKSNDNRSGDKGGKHKKEVRGNMCESQRSLFTSNDSIVTVPVAPIVDPNAVFNFDDHEWAELALMNGNPPVKSPSKSSSSSSVAAQLSSTTKPKAKESKKQTKTNSKESRTKRASKLLMSSRSSSFAGNSSSSKSSSGKSSSDLPRIPSGLRSAGSSGCVTDMDDGDVTDHSTTTTMTSSSSIGDVASMAMAGICDTLDPTAVCLQVHSDFFNDFCDFFDDEDVGAD